MNNFTPLIKLLVLAEGQLLGEILIEGSLVEICFSLFTCKFYSPLRERGEGNFPFKGPSKSRTRVLTTQLDFHMFSLLQGSVFLCLKLGKIFSLYVFSREDLKTFHTFSELFTCFTGKNCSSWTFFFHLKSGSLKS